MCFPPKGAITALSVSKITKNDIIPPSATWTSAARRRIGAPKITLAVIWVREKLEHATITQGLRHKGDVEPFGFNERSRSSTPAVAAMLHADAFVALSR